MKKTKQTKKSYTPSVSANDDFINDDEEEDEFDFEDLME